MKPDEKGGVALFRVRVSGPVIAMAVQGAGKVCEKEVQTGLALRTEWGLKKLPRHIAGP